MDEAIQDFQFDAELIVWCCCAKTYFHKSMRSDLGQNAGFHLTFHEMEESLHIVLLMTFFQS